MKIKTDYVPDGSKYYLTAGKEYQVEPYHDNRCLFIESDEGETLIISPNRCAHLNGRAWTVVEDAE